MATQNRISKPTGNLRLFRIIPLLCALIAGWVVAADEAKPAVSAQRTTVIVAAGDEQTITAAIATLPAGGGIVELGAGTFSIKQPIIIDRDGVELRGQGPATILFLAARSNCPVLVIGSSSTPTHRMVRQVTVRDLLIDGNRKEQQFECYQGVCDDRTIRNNGITIRGAEEIVIENVATCRARSGGVVLEKVCRQIRITGLDSYENEFDGLAAYETEDSHFTRLNLHHNLSAGVSIDWRFNRNLIADSNLSDNGSQGIFMRDSIGNNFERLTLQRNGEQGIFMAETRTIPGSACRYNKFRTVTITGNKAQGIRINDASCNVNTLENGLVQNNGQEDISLADYGQLAVIETAATL
jgi:hypothetical protein